MALHVVLKLFLFFAIPFQAYICLSVVFHLDGIPFWTKNK